MLRRHHPDGIQIAFDDHRLVNNAGLILPATLALHLGLPQLTEVGLVGEEYPGPRSVRLVPPDGVLRHEGFPFRRINLDQTFLGALKGKPQPVQIVQATAAAQADTEVLQDKLPHRLPNPVGQFDARLGGRLLPPALNAACCPSPRAGGGGGLLENQGP